MSVLPYPLLSLSLVLMWMALNSFTIGHLLLGSVIATFASWGMAALRPHKPHIRRWHLLPYLIGIVLIDIVRSNIAVVSIIVAGRRQRQRSGFLTIHLDLKDQTALAILAVIVTSTPGTAWLEYNSSNGTLLIHVLDLVDEQEWTDLVKNRYERLLMEIFE
ncbi:Na+/H+ antiporter subunit E (plasmid) [Rhizobium sp. TRM96647]|uniref:Na+/H+ antiporter subunit E n=1 Tax=unclassified Rhizobium TaxID=2613769 RepID=UPI001E2E96A8|nr:MULTISPECIES: Na+/H+ antiporter subunit E [unclassified Rhizobium]MCD2180588.1 Na+/H+ antiporter subunit E [Rhizobium sp. GN54]MCV3735324.1 Na+/H+ antiporter subunit E [Rhizobium sp. TRM96647]MCV3757913.1 Na+/H+ antiporter subunit E [Rhizobium sp. TRM96650]